MAASSGLERSTLTEDRARFADRVAEILSLERSLASLRSEKELMHQRLDSYKYPVLTLPNEITSEIFIHFLPVYPQCPPRTAILSPILLTHICHTWREIALTTPALWRAISLSLAASTTASQLHLLHTWLSRSGCCPLSIMNCGSPFLEAISPYRERWEHLQIRFSHPDLLYSESVLPSLRHLDLSFGSDTPSTAVLTFQDAPLLRTVALDHLAASVVVLPWSQLTSLTLTTILPHEYAPILKQTINLVHCELICYEEVVEHAVGIKLSYLESLVLSKANNDEAVPGYLDSFVLPALRTLQVPQDFLGRHPIGTIASFISRSGCKLHDVCITHGYRTDAMQANYRKNFPSVANFSFL